MAANVSATQLDGLYKEVYGSGGPPILAPEHAKLYKAIGNLEEAERVGKTYNYPVVLTLEQGYTCAGSNGDAFTIGTPVAMLMDNASLEGSEGLLATRISYRAASKAATSKGAFKRAMGVSLESHMRSHVMRRELEMRYGRSANALALSSASTGDTATQVTLTITPASWAVGIWAGMEGATFNFFNSGTGALISSGADAIFTLASVDADLRKLSFTGTSGGVTAANAVETLYVDFASYRATMTTTHTAMEGLDYFLPLAAGNTLWGISTNYTLWRGNSFSCSSGKLTVGKVLAGINKAVGKAGLDEAVYLHVSPETWADLGDSLASQRTFDKSYSTGEGTTGVEKVIYHGANGAINVVIDALVKGGEAWALPYKCLKKVGSTDITLKNPSKGENIFLELGTAAGFEYRSYSDFALFCNSPAKCVKFTTIVNSN
jgi:hypothetical protein